MALERHLVDNTCHCVSYLFFSSWKSVESKILWKFSLVLKGTHTHTHIRLCDLERLKKMERIGKDDR